MKKIFLSAVIFAVTVMSCKKEESKPAACNNDAASITGSYKITTIRYKASSTAPEQDFYATLPVCEKDDIIKLNANGTADYQDAGITCTPSGSYSGTWSVNGTTITIDGDAGTLQVFDCKKLVISKTGALVPGDIFTVTYEKQ